MKIKSNFKDFYDGVSRNDLDKNYSFIRKNNCVDEFNHINSGQNLNKISDLTICKKYFQFSFEDCSNKKYEVVYKMHLLGYCGKVISFFECIKKYNTNFNNYETWFEYDLNKVEHIFESEKTRTYELWHRRYIPFNKSNAFSKDYTNTFKHLFLEYNTPIFLITDGDDKKFNNLILNPVLKNIKFNKDAYQTYQDIRMFVENDLVKENQGKSPVGSDKILAESKGYNKYSFRKDKKVKIK